MSAVIGILIAIGILIECRYRDIKRELKKITKMTRDEEILTACKGFLSRYPSIDQAGLSIGFLDGAVWSDKHPVNVWHDASEEPQGDNWKILCVDDFDLSWVEKRANMIGLHNNWEEYTVIEGVKMWAYINDLLPKQFRNSKQAKGGEK